MDSPLKQQEKNEKELELLLLEFAGDSTISVSRKEPEWCRGHIRSCIIPKDEPLSLDWLAGRFGGEVLVVKVYAPQGSDRPAGIIAQRTVEICGPPRNGHGVELVRDPNSGKPILITQLERQKSLQGFAEIHAAPAPAPIVQQTGLSPELINTLMSAQAAQTKTMIDLLMGQVSTLQNTVMRLADRPAAAAGIDPLGQLKTTAETIAYLDKIKESIVPSERGGEGETDLYMGLIGKFMDLEMEKQKSKILPGAPGVVPALPGAPRNPMLQAAPGAPGVAPGAPGVAPGAPGALTDEILIAEVMKRLPELTAEQRKLYAEEILGQSIDFDDEADDDFDDEPDPGSSGIDEKI